MDMRTFRQRNTEHCNHSLESNPFLYPEHQTLHPGDLSTIAVAIMHRGPKLPFSWHQRTLELGAGTPLLTSDMYYNLGMNRQNVNQNSPKHIIEQTMSALQAAAFHVRLRWVDGFENLKPFHRLDQIFFVSDAQVTKSGRFFSEFMIQMDATFNPNVMKMPLANIVGVDNHEKTFTAALSFIRAEDCADFTFIIDCLNRLVFYGDIPKPYVLISCQAGGLHKAVREHSIWHPVFHQHCEWHMFKNIQTYVLRNRTFNTKDELHHVWDTVWAVIKCSHIGDLPVARQKMFEAMQICKVNNYLNSWEKDGREKRVLRAYTSQHPNLGCHSSARTEG